MSRPGKLIVIEGLDGCGKTTQAALLGENLQKRGYRTAVTAEPTDLETGRLIRRVLSGQVSCDPATCAALFAADRIAHNRHPEKGIEALLAGGTTVISDRYYYSSMAYQGMEAQADWVMALNKDCPYIRKPDLCLFLQADTDVCLARIHGGREPSELEIFENRESLERVRARFEQVFRSLPEEPVRCIDASGTVEQIAEEMLSVVLPLLEDA